MYKLPKNFQGNERLFTIPYLNIYINKMGIIYNGIASLIVYMIRPLINLYFKETLPSLGATFIVFVILNALVYPLGHAHVNKKKFDGGNIRYDIWYARKFKYLLSKGNLYTRLCK